MQTLLKRLNSLKKHRLILVLVSSFLICSCTEKDIRLKTFEGDMIYSFLEKDTTYSEFVEIIKKANLKGMLNAYGKYTCLAPTNNALNNLYKSYGIDFNIDSLSFNQIDTIAKTHIIQNIYLTDEMSDGVIPNTNMNKRYIEILFTFDEATSKFTVLLNDSSKIISRDNQVYNGVIHGIDRVLEPSNVELPDKIAENPNISIFYEALKLTHLSDSLRKIKDTSYKAEHVFLNIQNTTELITPEERKYGYTAFVEDNEVLKANGIENIDDLIAKAKELYPSSSEYDNDFSNRNNSLNKFISYHLVEKAIYLNKFFFTSNSVPNYTPDEFIETMYTNKIFKASRLNKRIVFNSNSDRTVKVVENASQTTINGVYHLVDDLMYYDESIDNMLLNTRIRFDIVSLFPEFANNNIRESRGVSDLISTGDWYGFELGYIKYLKMSKDTRLLYLAGKDNHQWANYQSDELMGLGAYDITMRLLPVPPGTYELRFGYSTNSGRSITQIYVDNKPIGIPLDLRIPASNPKIGYISDDETMDLGYENDKMMRNRGYMKAPDTFIWYDENPARTHSHVLRRIIGTFTFTDYSPHTLRFKSVMDDDSKACMMDYFEYVPKNIFNSPDGLPETRD